MRIKVLPEDIANKIAAGEVVERPASVVKELVENAIDAESTNISVEIQAGGKRSIRVIDNGIGMEREDALLALERHATSKIHSVEDLNAIRTLGFRGEALPSIASVCQLELITKTTDAINGTKLVVEGGIIKSVVEIGSSPGTRITVNNLFYNVPARLKFLKSDSTEMSHIINSVTWTALAHPQIQLKLSHNNRTLIDVRACDSIAERIYLLYGKDFAENLMEFTTNLPNFQLHSFIGKPDYTKSNRNYQLFFMNSRPIKSKIIGAALSEALRSMIPKDRFPVAFLFLTIASEDVDINVHPAKTEVRFRNERTIYGQIVRSLQSGIYKQKYIPNVKTGSSPFTKRGDLETTTEDRERRIPRLDRAIERMLQRQRQQTEVSQAPDTVQPSEIPLDDESAAEDKTPGISTKSEAEDGISMGLDHSTYSSRLPRQRGDESAADMELELLDFDNIRLKTNLFNTYIVAEGKHEVFFIDQHIASERVLYERFLRQLQADGIPGQGLLLPVTVELSATQLAIFNEHIELFREIGFDVEAFGGNTILVRAVPSTLPNSETAEAIMELIDNLSDDTGKEDRLLEAQGQALVILACHSAVKAGAKLAMEEMVNLVKELSQTSQPFTCPHSRPIIVRMSKSELESRFKRK
ncbi:TPA: DNA mismatch repair endonuclease MutL [Candidatus Poribacteria bacterium]|nr:DNA mismatch repair endonuclease MutL [Candidatus Poribacteria bacterium]